MRKPFEHWSAICAFTFRERVRRPKFIVITILISLLLILGIAIPVIISAKPDKEDEENPILEDMDTILWKNETDIAIDSEALQAMMDENDTTKGIKLQMMDSSREEIAKAAKENGKAVGMVFSKDGDKYALTMIMPHDTDIDEDNISEIGNTIAPMLHDQLMILGEVNPISLMLTNLEVTGNTILIGEDTSLVAMLLKQFLPMLFGLLLYFLLILYGQDLSQEVSTEKTSKLMEMMLTSVHPNALILGKVVAVFSVAMLQCFIWIGSLFVAVFGGGFLATKIYPTGGSGISTMINFVREHIGENAFSIPGIVMAIIIFVFGALLFFCLAAMAGSMVSKPEDTASTQPIFVFPILICWIVPYFAGLMENHALMNVCRYIPFTAPFCLPVDLIIGSTGYLPGIFAMVTILLTAAVLIYISAKIYRGLVLYIGQKFSWKVVWGIIRGK